MPKGYPLAGFRQPRSYQPGKAAWKRLYNNNHYGPKSGGVLTLEEFIRFVTQPCHYCAAPPPRVNPYGSTYEICVNSSTRQPSYQWWEDCWIHAHGIDKLHPAPDYSDLTNLVPCCKTCNWLKGKLPAGQFVAHINKIYHHQNQLEWNYL